MGFQGLIHFPLKASRVCLLCTADSCVLFKYNTGVCNSLGVFLMSCFIVVTSHDVFDFFGNLAYLLLFFPLAGIFSRPVFDCLYIDHVLFCWELLFFACCCFLRRN